MKNSIVLFLASLIVGVSVFAAQPVKPVYSVVVSEQTNANADWAPVVKALQDKYAGKFDVKVVLWKELSDALPALKEQQPTYICFVCQPSEAKPAFVVACHQLTRQLDDDPYTDAIWAILTGFEPADALRIAAAPDMTVTTLCAATEVPLNAFESGICYDELVKGKVVFKEKGKEIVEKDDGPADTTKPIADAMAQNQVFVTSGHASTRDWMIGYTYRNGFFVSEKGQLYGRPVTGDKFAITQTNAKIHLGVGNCLIGGIDGENAMTLALIHSAGVNTQVGYVVPSWFGYMGWGMLDYYVEQPGRFTVAEAFYANNQALTWLLNRKDTPEQMKRGLSFDQNVVAIYGDPAWQNKIQAQDSGWKQELTSKALDNGKTEWTLTITPLKGKDSFKLLSYNGSQRGGRPIFQFLPQRVKNVEIQDGNPFDALVTDNFILLSAPDKCRDGAPVQIRFVAE